MQIHLKIVWINVKKLKFRNGSKNLGQSEKDQKDGWDVFDLFLAPRLMLKKSQWEDKVAFKKHNWGFSNDQWFVEVYYIR